MLLGVLLTLAFMSASAEPARLLDTSRRTSERFAECIELETRQRYDDAFNAYLKLIEESPQELVAADGEKWWQPLRVVAMRRIAAQPQLRERFRQKLESDAEALLKADHRDEAQLRRLAEQFTPTAAGQRALDRLGELAFERGDFAQARQDWSRLELGATDDRAQIEAKILLSSAQLGEAIGPSLVQFRMEHPESKGRLAGQEGVLHKLLSQLHSTSPAVKALQSSAFTFAVDNARRGVIDQPWPALPPLRRESTLSLTSSRKKNDPLAPPVSATASQLQFHPLAWRKCVILTDGNRVTAHDIECGQLLDTFGGGDEPTHEASTLTISGDRVYAVLSSPHRIVALEREPGLAEFRWRKAMEINPLDGETFEGAPIVLGTHLFIASVKSAGNRLTLSITCFEDSRRLWSRPVVELPMDAAVPRRAALLSAAAGRLVLNTDRGLVLALDALTGHVAWAHRYASRGPRGVTDDLMPAPRDLCPPVISDGRVFVAPRDINEILAFDLWTGQSLWPRPPVLEVVQLLGVLNNRLIVTAQGQFRGIGAIHVATGQIDVTWGSLQGLPPFGRGLIVGDCVLYPTRHNGLMVLDREGQLTYPPKLLREAPGGNVMYSDGWLLIATTDGILRWPFIDKNDPVKDRKAPKAGPVIGAR